MEQDSSSEGMDQLRQRYRLERQKRLRPDGMAQWRELKDEFEDLDRDPFVEPGFTREPVVEETTVVIVGGGFAGMLTAIDLGKHGIADIRIVEKAGDFGGTWYWNRYPGCMCDVESYTYLPLLEETGFMPTERYASATEIFELLQVLARTFDLYPPCSLPDRRHRRRVGRRSACAGGSAPAGRSALDPFHGLGRRHSAQGQVAGNPRDR